MENDSTSHQDWLKSGSTAPELCLGCFEEGQRLSARDLAAKTGMLIATARNAVHRLAVWQQIKRTDDYDKQSAYYVLNPGAPPIPARAVGDKTVGPRDQSMMARTLRAYAGHAELSHEEAGLVSGVHLITLRTYVKRLMDKGLLEHCGYTIEKTGRVARHRITARGLAKALPAEKADVDDFDRPVFDVTEIIASAKSNRHPLDMAWGATLGAREGAGT